MDIKFYLRILIILLTVVSCKMKDENVLPKEIKLNKEKEILTYPDRLTIFSLTSEEIDTKEIIDFNIACDGVYNSYGWSKFKDLNKKEKIYIEEIIEEKLANDKNESLFNLKGEMSNNDDLLFSGCYEEMKSSSNSTYNFFKSMNFLDVSHRILYRFEYID